MQSLCCQLVFGNSFRRLRHQLANRTLQEINTLAQTAADITIGKHALHNAIRINNGYSTQTFVSNNKQSVLYLGICQYSRVLLALMHNAAYGQKQLASQAAARMEDSKLACGKVMLFEQRQSQCITIGQRCGSAACRS